MATGLVLRSGGAKGSFEGGALQYLCHYGFVADVMCSTSFGSVNAIQLAHGVGRS
jgi:NTE family protein